MRDRVALIAASTSGIRQACVEIFQREKWRVIGIAHSERTISNDGFLGMSCDLTNALATADACALALCRWEHIDAVMHSVGDIETASSWHKLGRVAKPEEVPQFAEYLASEKGQWITGRDFVIDGGMLL